ncbi:MAG: hypothetical protein BWZ08_01373 [candidate division BRC1 bacterium ADurb.BinA292]|nr:MAG: hypothetical protein BWZ08_01373 [candidate division BRC1 bacterium ADurb.BinA292]
MPVEVPPAHQRTGVERPRNVGRVGGGAVMNRPDGPVARRRHQQLLAALGQPHDVIVAQVGHDRILAVIAHLEEPPVAARRRQHALAIGRDGQVVDRPLRRVPQRPAESVALQQDDLAARRPVIGLAGRRERLGQRLAHVARHLRRAGSRPRRGRPRHPHRQVHRLRRRRPLGIDRQRQTPRIGPHRADLLRPRVKHHLDLVRFRQIAVEPARILAADVERAGLAHQPVAVDPQVEQVGRFEVMNFPHVGRRAAPPQAEQFALGPRRDKHVAVGPLDHPPDELGLDRRVGRQRVVLRQPINVARRGGRRQHRPILKPQQRRQFRFGHLRDRFAGGLVQDAHQPPFVAGRGQHRPAGLGHRVPDDRRPAFTKLFARERRPDEPVRTERHRFELALAQIFIGVVLDRLGIDGEARGGRQAPSGRRQQQHADRSQERFLD